jgi:hypothetical protein
MSHSSNQRSALYRRLPLLGAAREWARSQVIGAVRTIGRTNDGRTIARETLDDLASWRATLPADAFSHVAPYPELGQAASGDLIAERRAVFITARFRSGSTLLWNLFRQVGNCTSYYEPLNERRWFDPSHRGQHTDATHRHVDEYWREYDGLEELSRYYRDDWTKRRLYMDQQSWDPDLMTYVRTLVGRAKDRPVLQFNRIDFRLAWFRHTFPAATLIHLYRNPRDQWCSSLGSSTSCNPSSGMSGFEKDDGFYLLGWAADLKHRFPFLAPETIEHPYRLFYYLWKLSFWFGHAYSHHSLSFEALTSNPRTELARLFDVVGIADADYDRLSALVEPTPSRWPRFASDAWFRAHETACEETLRDFFGEPAIASPESALTTAPGAPLGARLVAQVA